MADQYTVIGATGGPGLGVFLRLAQMGESVVGIARNQARISQVEAILKAQGLSTARLIQADLSVISGPLLADLAATTHLVGASRAPFITSLAAGMPKLEQIVAIGSTRIYSRFADARKAEMQVMVDYLEGQAVPYTILHPSLIYGGTGYNNVERVRSLLRFCPLIPLVDSGSSLIQPVHNDDVVRAVLAAFGNLDVLGKTIVVAGPVAVPYEEFIQAIAREMGKHANCFDLPVPLLLMLAAALRWIPLLPSIKSDEIRRLTEDKNFSVSAMHSLLGFDPMPLKRGLRVFYGMDEAGEHFAEW